MKRIYAVFIALISQLYCFAQHDSTALPLSTAEPKIFTFVEQMPEFPGGEGELMRFIRQNIIYPPMELDEEIQGRVLVRFVVNETGIVGDVQVIKSVSPGLDAEAIRVVNLLPDFKPGYQQGKPVKVYYNIPIMFRLVDDDKTIMKKLSDKMPGDKNIIKGVSLYQSGNYKEAIKEFEPLTHKKTDGLAYAALAECYKKTGDKTKLCEALQKSVASGYKDAGIDLKKMCK